MAVELRFYRATRRRCDWDNLAKLVCDALNGIAWRDDDQIADARVVKGHDPENPRTEVTVGPLRSLEAHVGGGSWAAVEDADRERAEATRRVKGEEPA